MAAIDTSYGLFLHDLRAILYLESRLDDQLMDMSDEVTNEDLAQVLEDHADETSQQVQRLQDVFELLGVDPEEHDAADFKGLFEEAEHLNEDIMEIELFNLELLGTAIKVEHIEIATYENLLRLADRFDVDEEVRELLEENLSEERKALERLEDLSEQSWFNQIIDDLMP